MTLDTTSHRWCNERQEPGDGAESTALDVSRVVHFYTQGIRGIRGSLIAAAILSVFLWEAVPHFRLVAWFLLYAAACGAGEALYRRFRKATDLEQTVHGWCKRFVILSIVGGILWGAIPLFLFPKESILHQALLTFVLGGMSIGIAISHGAVRAAHVPFILAVYVPLVCRYFYEGSETQITMGILLMVFLVYLIGAADRMRRSVMESLNLRFRNEGLVETLKHEKDALDRLNADLRSEVSERRQAEQALLESEERFHKLYAVSPYPMVVHDGKVVLSVNPASAKLVGAFSPESLEGQSIWDHIHPDSVPDTREGIERLATTKNAVQFSDLRFLTRDGGTVEVEVVSVPTTYKGVPAILAVGRDVTEARRSEERLKASLAEKEILLREIHHRVKNNLQVISSLMRLQARHTTGKSLEEIFSETQERLLSMALIHEKLYGSNDMAKIDFEAYMHTLVKHVLHSAGVLDSRIALRQTSEKVFLGLESAIPCGLIVNELVSNAIKHAFPDGREGWICTSLLANECTIEMTVADNGIGLPEGTDWQKPRTLGLQLVSSLARQIKAELDVTVSEGTEFRITFEDHVKKN